MFHFLLSGASSRFAYQGSQNRLRSQVANINDIPEENCKSTEACAAILPMRLNGIARGGDRQTKSHEASGKTVPKILVEAVLVMWW